MLSEISRVLNKDGVYILITYGDKSKRQELLENVEKKIIIFNLFISFLKASF